MNVDLNNWLTATWDRVSDVLYGHEDPSQVKSLYTRSPESPVPPAKNMQEPSADMWIQLLRRHAKGEGTKLTYL